ncbi:hypothetical protein C0J52_10812 [Blattella germanica]|nr:hypothetical protein C0J52_10812 [Blattella germanica]
MSSYPLHQHIYRDITLFPCLDNEFSHQDWRIWDHCVLPCRVLMKYRFHHLLMFPMTLVMT